MINTTTKDPVCGMDVDASADTVQFNHKGQTYHFCGPDCKDKFAHTPEQYLNKTAVAADAGKAGCCG